MLKLARSQWWNASHRCLKRDYHVSASCLKRMTYEDLKFSPFDMEKEMSNFLDYCPKVQNAAVESLLYEQLKSEYAKALDYTLLPGKMGQARIVMRMFNGLVPHTDWDDAIREQLYASIWVLELNWMLYNILDDFGDGAELRFKKPCWHKLRPGNELLFPSFVMMIRESADSILKKFIKDPHTRENLRDVVKYTHIGILEDQFLFFNLPDFKKAIADGSVHDAHKDRFISLTEVAKCLASFPIFLAGYRTVPIFVQKQMDEFFRITGEMRTTENDYADCFKPNTIYQDISAGKISWVLSTAVSLASKEQLKIINESYGRPDTADHERVLRVFKDLRIPELYEQLQLRLHNETLEVIESIPDIRFRTAFLDFYNETLIQYQPLSKTVQRWL